MSQPGVVAASTPHAAHEAHHEELGFWRKYVFSVDHKVIGIQYAITAPPVPAVRLHADDDDALAARLSGRRASADRRAARRRAHAPGGVMLPEFYNQLGAMHGTIMVFLGVVPLAVGGFGNFVMPLQIGAPDMAFPQAQHDELLGVLPRRRDRCWPASSCRAARRSPAGRRIRRSRSSRPRARRCGWSA